MAYTNLDLTIIAEQVLNEYKRGTRETAAFLRNVKQYVLPPGVASLDVPKPGAVTADTRTAGSANPTAEKPTDTKFTLTPITEYIALIGTDELEIVGNAYNIAEFYAPQMAGSIIDSLSAILWAKVPALTSNVQGAFGSTPDLDILNLAYEDLFDAKAYSDGTWKAVIGGAEAAAWKTEATWNAQGPASQDAIVHGKVGNRYGFEILEDQGRYADGTDRSNVAFHPLAFAVGFRSSMPDLPGHVQGQATDPDSGLTIFTDYYAVNDSTTGAGTNLKAFVVADVETAYETWAVEIKG